jgi:hypothetical protein
MSEANKNKEIDRGGHVYYFEPNDSDLLGKDQDNQDVAIVPHLEDLCIAMTLTADMYSRRKTHIPKVSSSDDGKIYSRSISWVSYVNGMNGDTDVNQQLINAGVEMGDNKYLTTYYTEISADNYVENELVEGLGVTSVNISYESWYTPTITINFVDVHGSSLWGREEAIHDKDGNITSDTLLGVFFQQPYPLFRLQVKGFLGHEVTYQLSVSSFKGKYNSQTGNFEATATFIGYSYSLLTDIPLKMIAYVSEMSYVGKQYWDEKCQTKEWEMIDADGTRRPPVKLYQLIQDIRSAVSAIKAQDAKNCDETPSETSTTTQKEDNTTEGQKVTLTENANVKKAADATTDIDAIETALTAFITECKTLSETTYGGKLIIGKEVGSNTVYKEQMLLLFSNDGNKTISLTSTNFGNAYRTFSTAIQKYNKKNEKNCFENACKDVLKTNEATDGNETNKNKINIEKIFEICDESKKDNTIVTIIDNKNLSDVKINNVSLYNDTVSQLNDLIKKYDGKTVSNGHGFGEYAMLIPLGQMRSDIATIKKKIASVGANTENRVESETQNRSNAIEKIKGSNSDSEDVVTETMKKRIVDIIGFEPTIGNFVKMVMCHLETFVEVMMHCADQIYTDRDRRTCANFNMSLDDTDIPYGNKDGSGEGFIYPWPALYNPAPKKNSETSSNNGKYEMLGWTQDYLPVDKGLAWEEEKVVLSSMDAMERCEEEGKLRNRSESYTYACLPMSGSDLATRSPFIEVAPYCKDIENLAPYLGLRIANTIGVADYNCDATIAEAIGYMDALNLISATSNYKKLKEAITSKDTNQDFASQVINLLTCQNTIKQSSETEKGKQYNLFEFIKSGDGNAYSTDRHPMFIESGSDYKYSYTYSKPLSGDTMISVVPTTVKRFSGSNAPYLNNVFSKDSLKKSDGSTVTVLTPRLHETGNSTGTSQWFTYLTKTNDLFPTDSLSKDYTNEQLFTVMTKQPAVQTLISQIEALKEGKVKFKDYEVKGEDNDSLLKKFIEHRFKTSLTDYYKFYCNSKCNYNVLIPLISKADETYYKDNLCNSEEEVSTTKFNSNWSTNSSSKLFKKLSLSVKEANKTFKNSSSEYTLSDVMVGELPILTNSGTKCSIFGCRLYYQQNDCESSDEKLIMKRKAYLFLSAMMAGVDKSITKIADGIFKKDDCSLIDLLPPFYVYFIGSLLWRRTEYDNSSTDPKKRVDPVNFSGFEYPNVDTSIISKDKNIGYITTSSKVSWNTLSDYFDSYDNIDVAVRNKLVRVFEEFAASQGFQDIVDNCELRATDGSIINKSKWNELKAMWKASGFDKTSPSQWGNIFSNMWGNYSSISVPEGLPEVLRLLMNENNKVKSNILFIYGIMGGYIATRGTKSRVGKDNKREVTVTSAQMKGYLNGFKKRIEDIKETSDKKVSEEVTISMKEINRDVAVANYYALKHLWDSWLISAPRDQFTIKNFFNKYFVFIDSFYINMYNTIKLNCEVIKDAYDSGIQESNVLTFITNITSKERCMFFALPTFLDSNIMENGETTYNAYKNNKTDLSYKKENLRSMFTPYAFNDMNLPTPNNVFVFIYTHPYSANAAENTDKRFDSYMINDTGTWPGQLNVSLFGENTDKNVLQSLGTAYAFPNNGKPDDDDELITARYAYRMPCFGVAVNRGNNIMFKSINVNMDSTQITSVSAQTYEDILTKYGKDGAKRVFFHGQDIFNIYSQYAYSCEIEMLGCVQIQPLMYFQLLNIPMWRGTYMIYKVSHTMQPGSMTTRFTGMKMSRTQAPYATGYYSVGKKGSESNKKNNGSGNSSNASGSGTAAVGGEKMFKNILGGVSYKITSPYDVQRTKNGKTYWHTGIDLSTGKEGTPLHAPWDGTVTDVLFNRGDAGNYLKFTDTNNKNMVIYMHCQKFNVTRGQSVKSGEILAYLGSTGHSTGPHLHLELYVNGEFTMGQSKRHGGTGTHVNPSVEYGNTTSSGGSTSTDSASVYTSDASTVSSTSSYGKTDTASKKKTKTQNGIYAIGDSWTEGIAQTNYFANGCFKRSESLDNVRKNRVPHALNYWPKAKIFVLLCGLNDLYNTSVKRVSIYKQMIQKIKSKGLKCCICTFPQLDPKKNTLIHLLNVDIQYAAKVCNIQCITIPDYVTHMDGLMVGKSLLTKDGLHLSDWNPIAKYITDSIKL